MATGFSADDVEKVRAATDIVSLFQEIVPVTQKGGAYWCVCPFHNDKNPSLKIDPGRQSFHCFGCQASGDVFSFVKLADGCEFPEAVQKLADRAHITLSGNGGKPAVNYGYKARLKEVCRETADYYHQQLMRLRTPVADSARSYLSGRSLGGAVPNNWNLGFAPGNTALVHHLSQKGFTSKEMIDADVAVAGDGGRLRDRYFNRIMFPIYDLQGECIAFGGRVIGKGEPKYLNSKETLIFKKSHELFGFDKAKNAITTTGVAVIMEGYTDVILAHEAGFTNAVATLGTALTIHHIRQLSKFAKRRIVYLFDGDAAGQRAIERALLFIDSSMTPEAGKMQVELCAVTLPDDLDPADYISRYGVEEFRKRVDEALPLMEFGIQRKLAQFDLSTAEGRSAALAAGIQVLAPIKDSILAKDYACQLAGQLRIREEVALDELKAVKPPANLSESFDESRIVRTDIYGREIEGAEIPALPDYDNPRLGFEREFLSAVACNPAEAAPFVPLLAEIRWREELHRKLSGFLVEALGANPGTSCASLVSDASQVEPRAGAVLLGGNLRAGSVTDLLTYTYEELRMGDLEEGITSGRLRLSALSRSGKSETPEAEELFRQISADQQTLLKLKKEHKPLV